jgi:ADP-heptose:LPS heptosyltransferase
LAVHVRPFLAQVERRAAEVRAPGSPLPGVRRVVVVRSDRLGDLVLTLPAVDALRRAYPAARLALMVRPHLAALARRVEGVEQVLEAEPGLLRRARRLRAYDADLAVCISREPETALAAALAGVRQRVGSAYRLYSPLCHRRVQEHRRTGDRHEVEYALAFAHRAGAVAGPARFPIRPSAEAERSVRRWIEVHRVRDRFVLLHPGSGGSCPAWPVERYVELASTLVAHGAGVVVSIGPADGSIGTSLRSGPREVRALPQFTGGLDELAALCLRAGVVASNSTGPLHLAAALGAKTLGFYPPWTSCGYRRWGPYAADGWALVAHSEEALAWTRPLRARHGRALMRALGADTAAACILELLAGRPPALGPRPALPVEP